MLMYFLADTGLLTFMLLTANMEIVACALIIKKLFCLESSLGVCHIIHTYICSNKNI